VISIYCDEDVDILIKPLLEAKGFKVLTTLDEKMLGASDLQQMDYAVKRECVFLTHNRAHFEELYTGRVAKGLQHPGAVIAIRRNVYELARRVSSVFSDYTKESIKNQILYV
jgi:hypothetical protein